MLQLEDYNFRQVKVAKEMELKQKSLMSKNTKKNYVELAPSFQLCFNYVSLHHHHFSGACRNLCIRINFFTFSMTFIFRDSDFVQLFSHVLTFTSVTK